LKKPRKGYAFYWDREIVGLGVRISAATNERVWVVGLRDRRPPPTRRHRVMGDRAARDRASQIRGRCPRR